MNGVFVQVDDRRALVSAMKHMADSISKYDREAIARETIRKFSAVVIVPESC